MNTAVTPLPMTRAASASASTGAGLRRQFSRAGTAVWRALQSLGRARAHAQLLELADRCEALQPTLAKELRAASRQGPMD